MNISSHAQGGSFKVKWQKFGISTLVIMLIIGGVFVAAGLFAGSQSKIDSSWTRVNGHVVDSGRTTGRSVSDSPVVKFTVQNKDYLVNSSFGTSSNFDEGDVKEVAYNPNDPNQSKVVADVGTKTMIWLFPAIGFGLIMFALVAFMNSRKHTGKFNKLT